METTYPIFLEDARIGTAAVKKEGLYYYISCRCALSGEVMYKILAACGDRQEDLGICVPCGKSFGLETRLPVKRLGEGTFLFCAVPKDTQPQGKFVPIHPEEPFAYIQQLYKARLVKQKGEIGVELKE